MLYYATCPICTSVTAEADEVKNEQTIIKPEFQVIGILRQVACHCNDCGARFERTESYFLDSIDEVNVESEFEDDFVEEVKEEI